MISGMALGWDTAWAIAALRNGIPLVAAVPFAGQSDRWPVAARIRFDRILEMAQEVVVVSPGGYSGMAMQRRNMWMVDRCDALAALWSGSDGGTANCMRHAAQIGKPTINLWPEFTA